MNFIPVFFTDSADFSAFRRQGYVLEYFPPGSKSCWQEKMDYLVRKWGIETVIDLREPQIDLTAIAPKLRADDS